MDNMNTNAREHGKTQAMMYLEQKRKASSAETIGNVDEGKSEIISLPIYKLNTTYTSQRALRNKKLLLILTKIFSILLLYHTVMANGM